jgi:hypothetical protein
MLLIRVRKTSLRRRGKQAQRRLRRERGVGFPNRSSVIALLVSGAAQLIEAPGVLLARGAVDDRS